MQTYVRPVKTEVGKRTPRKRRADGTFEPLICTCRRCGRVYEYAYERGHSKTACNSCCKNGRVDRRALKRHLIELKGGRCQVCGYHRCHQALTFHHIDPSTKSFTIAGSHHRGWDVLVREVTKCVLVCFNCHQEIEVGVAEIPEHVVAEVQAAIVDVPRVARRGKGRPTRSEQNAQEETL